MTKHERKKLIIENALQIISNIKNENRTRWTEFINRKIDTILSSAYQFYILKDTQMVMDLIKRVAELEVIRKYPLIALNREKLSIEEIISICEFKYSKCGPTRNKDEIFTFYPIQKAGQKLSNFGTSFVPEFSKYNITVATYSPEALTETDVINLVAASMFFSDFPDSEIKDTLHKYFNRTGKLPSPYNLKYVSIVWGDLNTKNRAVLSIPCSEMSFNEDSGQYYAFFNTAGESYVSEYNEEYFTNSKFSKLSEIYREKIYGGNTDINIIDKYYAFFA